MSGTRPLAIGLLRVGPTIMPADIRQARVELGLLANVEGYALVETFELHDRLHDERDVLDAVEQLAVQLDADALIVSGLLDLGLVDDLADRARLLVRQVADGLVP